MVYLCALICLIGVGVAYLRDRSWCSPLVLFGFFWALMLFLSGLELYGIYPASDYSLFLITIGTISFIIGGLIKSRTKIKAPKSYVINQRLYIIAVIICILSLYLNISFIIEFIKSGFDIHYIYTIMAGIVGGRDNEMSGLYDPKLEIIQQFIGYPLLYTLVPISIVEYISKKEKLYLFIAILLSLLRFLFDFRRTYIVIIIVFIAFVLILKRQRNNINRQDSFERLYSYILRRKKETHPHQKSIANLFSKKKIIIGVVLIGLAAGFSFMSSTRRGDKGSEEYSLSSNFYYYYVGSIPYFSIRLSSLDDVNYTYGLTSFRGLASPVFAALGLLGFEKPPLMEIANENVNSLHDTVELISEDHPFNSYATCFFEFYLDAGVFGIIVLSLLFGFYSEKLYFKAKAHKTNRCIAKYALFVSLFLFLSVLHFNGVVVCYIWPFILERFFYKKSKRSVMIN